MARALAGVNPGLSSVAPAGQVLRVYILEPIQNSPYLRAIQPWVLSNLTVRPERATDDVSQLALDKARQLL